jgi:isoquinoline 1-oxidoreductase beta subunit
MAAPFGVSRREFLQVSAAAGTGLLISIYLSGCMDSPTAPLEPTVAALPEATAQPTLAPEPTALPTTPPEPVAWLEPNAFLKIDNTGTVTIILHKCELGQGVGTTFPMLVAEELEADWSKIRVEQVRADAIHGKPRTSGSDSTQDLYAPLRRAGAVAREMLIAAAAQTWEAEEGTCYAEEGAVVHRPTGQRLAYGELVETAASMPAPNTWEVDLKEPKDFRVIGTSLARLENPRIVDGSAVYGLDVQLPGMLYATVARCPVFGGTVASFDATSAKAVKGVRHVIEIDDGLAVVADNTWAALQGRQALEVTWDEGPNVDLSSESIRQSLFERLGSPGGSGDATDNPDKLEATYEVPFLAHVTPEPMNCTADVREDSCEVWAPTQNPGDAQATVEWLTRLPGEAIGLRIPLIGGGYGRRLQVDYVNQAVQVSQAVGAPVRVVWTREDDIQHDYYHPASLHHISANLERPGNARLRSEAFESEGIPTGAWRSATNLSPAFVQECFIDEVAAAIDRDPYELRLELPQYRRLRAVLELAATKADWGSALPERWGRGIACYSTWNVTPTAVVIEVFVDEDGNVRVHRVVCAVDCGTVINPDIVQAQMEGGIVLALTAGLKSEITVDHGQVQQSNLHDYPLLRFDEMPAIEVYMVPSESDPTGVGEMSVPPTPPALLNAVFAATGKRIRHLPIRPEDLK